MTARQQELAALAAQLIVEDGLDYQSAKRKAFGQLTGRRQPRPAHESLPTNEEVEEAVREHLAIFHGEDQPIRLLQLRASALRLMDSLRPTELWLTGAAANGTATEHSGLHLATIGDSSKELGIALINLGLTVHSDEVHGPQGSLDESLTIHWEGEPTQIRVVSHGQSLRRLGAISRSELVAMIQAGAALDPEHDAPPLFPI